MFILHMYTVGGQVSYIHGNVYISHKAPDQYWVNYSSKKFIIILVQAVWL